jgi:transcriptional regulator with XRE-family HTH domain
MSRAPDPGHSTHPLKDLREIIGVSQPDFARITGLSLDQIRSLEIGRRNQGKMSQAILDRIFMSIGAYWHEGKWIFLLLALDREPVPYTREHFTTFRTELLAEAAEREPAVYFLLHEFLSLLKAIPPKGFNGWFWRVYYLLDKWSKEVPFERTPFMLDPQWDRKEVRVLGYRKVFWSLLKGEEQDFIRLFEQARLAAAKNEPFAAEHEAYTTKRNKAAKPQAKKPPRSRSGPAAGSRSTS